MVRGKRIFNTPCSTKEPYTSLFVGYPRVNNGVGWLGKTHVYRFFIHDPIFFENGIKGTIEHGHNNNLTLELGSVAYWYQNKAVILPQALTKEQCKLMRLSALQKFINGEAHGARLKKITLLYRGMNR